MENCSHFRREKNPFESNVDIEHTTICTGYLSRDVRQFISFDICLNVRPKFAIPELYLRKSQHEEANTLRKKTQKRRHSLI